MAMNPRIRYLYVMILEHDWKPKIQESEANVYRIMLTKPGQDYGPFVLGPIQ